eukprot:scaffold18654_cov146-Skeletonema_marinoi.AAC.2
MIDTVHPHSPVVWFPVLSRAQQYEGITCNARGALSQHVFGYGSAQLAALTLQRMDLGSSTLGALVIVVSLLLASNALQLLLPM